jgi:hypothetical protein
MIYYQFVLKLDKDSLPVSMKRKYRSEDRALLALKRYVKKGIRGCLVTFFVNGERDYGMKDTREF